MKSLFSECVASFAVKSSEILIMNTTLLKIPDIFIDNFGVTLSFDSLTRPWTQIRPVVFWTCWSSYLSLNICLLKENENNETFDLTSPMITGVQRLFHI